MEPTPNPTAASLLGFLHDGPMTGGELVRHAAERISNFWAMTPSQVYRELATLADRGLVSPGDRGPRDAQPFALTPLGRKVFARWLREVPRKETVRSSLLLVVAFADHLDDGELDRLVAQERASHREVLAGYRQRREALPAGAPRSALATLEFGIRHEQAVLDWLDDLPGLLTQR